MHYIFHKLASPQLLEKFKDCVCREVYRIRGVSGPLDPESVEYVVNKTSAVHRRQGAQRTTAEPTLNPTVHYNDTDLTPLYGSKHDSL